MNTTIDLFLLGNIGLSFICGIFIFHYAIKLAHKYHFVDIPTSRRRHPAPMPIIGGLAIFATWSFSILIYSLTHHQWLIRHKQGLLVLSTTLLILLGVGLIDDLKGVRPLGKLFWQSFAALILVRYEPRIHSLCAYWSHQLGPYLGALIWPIIMTWLVGLSNAINLIDGLDGLAGGYSLLVTASLAVLASVWGIFGEFGLITMLLLIPAIMAFLIYNWHPAKIFLGDNGSLPLGFLIAAVSLMAPPSRSSIILLVSILLMMGYPILDMGLCVLRRYRKNNPLFKADRNHLHYRVLRMGLSVPQTTILLLNISLSLQITALAINLMPKNAALIVIGSAALSVGNILYFIRVTEKHKVSKLSRIAKLKYNDRTSLAVLPLRKRVIAHIELESLFEAALLEEKHRIDGILTSLQLMLKTLTRKDDFVVLSNNKLSIIFHYSDSRSFNTTELYQAIRKKLELFQKTFEIQYSLAALPIRFETKPYRKETCSEINAA